ncbi:monocarboxylate transporter 12-like [Argiope bruennichi]|uniref:monocarboxylate transporter 12-like n=1 Tax=Argiope bruennichi TaxID=94029 RepID=UPI002494A593|nr:monocarboxylate transporter 12-like [Argiope bruennichi]
MAAIGCSENGHGEMVGVSGKKRKVEGPDNGYAWIVAVAACVINFIMAGLGRMSGILFVAFIELFGVDRRSASMPSSVRSSARNLLGPIVGILGQKYGVRSITMIGGIVASTSAISCFFVNEITWITVLWGGLNGMGNALTVTLPQVIIGQYFDKYRTTASGMAFSGGCLGSFLFPVLLENLIHSFGIEGTFLIIGGIIMHTIPAAMILTKPSWLKSKKQAKDIENADKPKFVISTESSVSDEVAERAVKRRLAKQESMKNFLKNGPSLRILRQNSDIVAKILSNAAPDVQTSVLDMDSEKAALYMESCLCSEMEILLQSIETSLGIRSSQQNLNLTSVNLAIPEKEPLKMMRSMKGPYLAVEQPLGSCGIKKSKSVPDLFKMSNEPCVNVLSKLKVLLGMKISQITSVCPGESKRRILKVSKELKKLYHVSAKLDINGNGVSSVHSAKYLVSTNGTDHSSNSFWDHIKTAIKLHVNPMFLLICLCRAVHFIVFIPVMTIVVDFVMDKGLLEQDGKYAIAVLSLGDLAGRLCFGWVTDKGFLSLPKYMMLVMIAHGASTAFLPLMQTQLTIFIVLGIFGLLQGSLFVRHPVLVSKYMGKHEQSIAMGCVNFFSGILGFGLPTYIGFFRDTLDSYDYIFFINGAGGALVGLLWALEPYLLRRSTRISDKSGSV